MDENRIRERAYAIWEREGCPEGRHDAHWEQARQELMDEERRERDRAEIGAPEAFYGNVLHPSGRNSGGSLRPAAEEMGGLEGQPTVRGRSRAPGGQDESGGGA